MARGATPGHRFGGREKGTPNKDTKALKDLIAQACGEDWDPVVEMAQIAKTGLQVQYDPATGEPFIDPATNKPLLLPVDNKIRARFREECSSYIHAKRKAVEHSQDPDNPLLRQVELIFAGPGDDE